MNDKCPATLARNLVLLNIIDDVDPDKPSDVAFLWNVWYNVFWDENTADRFRSSVQSLLDSELLDNQYPIGCNGSMVRIGDPELASQLKEILKWWIRAIHEVSVEDVQMKR